MTFIYDSGKIENPNNPRSTTKYEILPPPSKENYASEPAPWRIADLFTKTPPEEIEGPG